MIVSLSVPQWRAFLRSLRPLALGLFLRELALELNQRGFNRWRLLSDLADEIHDEEQRTQRQAAETLLASSKARGRDRAIPPAA